MLLPITDYNASSIGMVKVAKGQSWGFTPCSAAMVIV